jgi:hypothetical protein
MSDTLATDHRAIMRGWPASLVEIAEVIGPAATLRLVDAYGGTVCYVPMQVDPEHRLAQAIGLDAAKKLVARYCGEKVEVAVLHVARTRKALIAQTPGGVSEVARALGVTRRWVRMVRNVARGDPRQIDMFPSADKSE